MNIFSAEAHTGDVRTDTKDKPFGGHHTRLHLKNEQYHSFLYVKLANIFVKVMQAILVETLLK